MSVLSIISEYNPYHRGHAYLLEEAKRLTGASHAISIMSGNFSQQGHPMLADKLSRASAAAQAGIDLVFEIPVIYATGSAGDFAEGAVSLLHALGNVDWLCFGVEDPDPELFDRVTDTLLSEPAAFRSALDRSVREGFSFPSARENALVFVLGEDVRGFLRRPNNILGIEYILMLKRLGSSIRPVMIRRMGEYHAESGESGFSSASAIRSRLIPLSPEDRRSLLKKELPEGSYDRYAALSHLPILTDDQFTPFLTARLLSAPGRGTEPIPEPEDLPLDMTTAVYRRLMDIPLPATWAEAVNALHTKNVTMSRITRSLLHLMLGITNGDRRRLKEEGCVFYANLLSARGESTHLLRSLQETARIPVISKRSAYFPEPLSSAARLWQLDKNATDLYNQMLFLAGGERLKDESRSKPRIVGQDE